MEDLHINWFPGHMKKAIDDIKACIKAFDLVVQIVDARAPLSTLNPEVQTLIKKYRLHCLVIVNKMDLADRVMTKQWIEYLEANVGPCLLINSKSKLQKKMFWNLTNRELSSEIKRLKAKGIVNPQLKMLVVGVPNVGKSTFINNILERRKAGVGNIPGYTKGQQLFKVADNWLMMDTPGILWPKLNTSDLQLNLVLAHAINPNILPLEKVTAYGLAKIVKLVPNFTNHFYNFSWDVKAQPLEELKTLLSQSFSHTPPEQACKNILYKISNQSEFRMCWELPEQ